MRCSFFEPLLDDFVEGSLPAATHAKVAAHVAACPSCAALLAEFRVIDALLLQPRRLEPAPNFTFAVMADVRGLPQPHAQRIPALGVLGAYLAFAWAAIALFFALGKGLASNSLGSLVEWLQRSGASVASAADATYRVFGGNGFHVSAAMAAILGFDLALAALAFAGFNLLRPRLAARAVRLSDLR